tara:strand:+ start:81 stop:548 length:468 start_codon:yes stop_codon:yes gene_type:complete
MFQSSIQGPLGLTPTVIDVRVTARGGAKVKGEVVKFGTLATTSDAAITTTAVGSKTSIFSNVIESAANPTTGELHGVCLEAIADDAEGMVRFQGVVDALGGDTSAIGVATTVEGASGELIATTTETDVVLALPLVALTNGGLHSVLFNGAGFGNV